MSDNSRCRYQRPRVSRPEAWSWSMTEGPCLVALGACERTGAASTHPETPAGKTNPDAHEAKGKKRAAGPA